MSEQDDLIVQNLADQLTANGEASIRTGERRSDSAATKLLKSAAELAGVEVTTSKGEANCRIAKVK